MRQRSIWWVAVALVALVAALPPTPAAGAGEAPAGAAEPHMEVDWSMSCKECHREMTPEVVAAWEEGAHGKVNVGCFVCHGDGIEEFHPSPGTARCVGCHDRQAVDFEAAPVSSCFDCHDGHTLRFHHWTPAEERGESDD